MKIRILTNSYCLWFVAAMLSLTVTSPAAPISWTGNGDPNASGNWSAPANWGTASYPSTADIATLGDVTTGTRVVSYDVANGTLSGLIFTQTTAGATNELDLYNNLTVNSAVNIGASAGAARVKVATTTAQLTFSTSALTISSGGTLEVGLGSSGTSVNTNIGGAVTVSGGSILINQAGGSTTAYASFNNGLTMTSGSISIDNGGGKDSRISVGTLNITGGTYGKTTNNVFGSTYIYGVTSTMTGFTWTGYGSALVLAAGNQSLLIDQHLYDITLRNISGNAIKTITSSEATHSFQTIQLAQATAGATTLLKMGSDLNGNTTNTTLKWAGVAAPGAGTTITLGVDLNGHALDITSNSSLWKPDSGSNFTTMWTITNSSATTGSFAATGFDFSTSTYVGTVVGDSVVLESRGGNNTANNLSDTSAAPGAISSASTFLYDGGASSATAATLISNRTIGSLKVDKKPVAGTSSNLKLLSAITAAGNVAINDAGSQINLNGQILTLTGSAKLAGIGTYSSDVAGAQIRFAAGSTGGLDINGTGAVGAINLAGGSLESIDLSNAAVSIFDINGTTVGSFDVLNLNLSTIVYGGVLQLNFGYTPVTNDQFQIFSNVGAGSTGNFTSITSNLGGGYSFGFSSSTGTVTVTVVPEPSASLLMFVGGILMMTAHRMRRVRHAEV